MPDHDCTQETYRAVNNRLTGAPGVLFLWLEGSLHIIPYMIYLGTGPEKLYFEELKHLLNVCPLIDFYLRFSKIWLKFFYGYCAASYCGIVFELKICPSKVSFCKIFYNLITQLEPECGIFSKRTACNFFQTNDIDSKFCMMIVNNSMWNIKKNP